jgi:ABC-type dipeptide/oligopeptide/nickel transport system ATPase component
VVLYRGRVVEDGPTPEVFGTPRHPYTALLLASAPNLTRQRAPVPADLRRAEPAPVATEQCAEQPERWRSARPGWPAITTTAGGRRCGPVRSEHRDRAARVGRVGRHAV